MIEKRFYLNEGEIGVLKILDLKEDNEAIYHTASKSDMKLIVELLNKLAKENSAFKIDDEFKKKSYSKLLDSFIDLKKKYQTLKKENQQLRELLENGLEVSQCEIDEELRRRKNERE